jgi:ribosomal protein S12 methylthiotransferase accessory factor YcaO
MTGPSPKVYEGIKSAPPEHTINRITEGFAQLGFRVQYQSKDINHDVLFSGVARIEGLGWSANGKGVTAILAKASAYAELAERFSTSFYVAYSPFVEIVARHDLLFRGFSSDYTRVSRLTDYAFLPGYRTEPDAGQSSSFAPYVFQGPLQVRESDLRK